MMREIRPRVWTTVGAVMVAVVTATVGSSGPAGADVSSVAGSAYGYHAYNLTLFGGPQPDVGPTPTVTLAPDAANSPRTATAPNGLVFIAETAVVFTSDQIDVATSGQLGANGFATSSATIRNVNKSTTQPAETGGEIITADTLASTCRASETGRTASTTITNGKLRTDSGYAVNDDPDYDDPGEIPPVFVDLPANPLPNTAYEGIIRFSATGTPDRFRVVFNEQVVGANSVTVNAVHEYFGITQGSRLKGDLVAGRSVCGMTVNRPPVAADDSYTAPMLFGISVPAPGLLGNDTDPDGGPLTATLVSGAANGTATVNPDGSFTYYANFLFTGTDSFTYRVTDDRGLSDTATVTITVNLLL